MRTATRLINLIMLLQRRPQQKAADLARELDVSVRTLHRYLGMLDEMGLPIYTERGPHGGISLVRGYKMLPLVFTPEEAVALYLGTDLAPEIRGPLHGEAARCAQTKLDTVLPHQQRHEAAWATGALLAKGIRGDLLAPVAAQLRALSHAVRTGQRVSFCYRSRGQVDPQTRAVDVYVLIYRWSRWYAVGYCHLREEIRLFRVDRMDELQVLDEHFVKPDDFDVHPYLADEIGPQMAVHARMRFLPEFAHLAHDNRGYWETMAVQPDGAVEVTFATPDLIWAASTVMSYGGAAVVLEPPELREMVRAWAAAMVAQYQ